MQCQKTNCFFSVAGLKPLSIDVLTSENMQSAIACNCVRGLKLPGEGWFYKRTKKGVYYLAKMIILTVIVLATIA